MHEETNVQDLQGRLALIENMIAEGRRTTESWGWTFVLWGVAYYIAIAWSAWGHTSLAWPVTMMSAAILTGILASRIAVKNPGTTVGRAMMAIWVAMGISLFTVLLALGMTGRLESHLSIAIVGALLGCANATSAMILKWKMQFASAVVWWILVVVACFGTDTQTSIAFLVAIFLCQIVFGIYGMVCESRARALRGAAHA